MRRLLLALMLLSSVAFAADPDPILTPGATYNVTAAEVCQPGYSRRTRKVSTKAKRQVFRRYKIQYFPHAYQLDHALSLCLGGSNDVTNLWPQPIEEALEKDRVEAYLCRQVCTNRMTLQEARDRERSWRQEMKHLKKPATERP